MHMYLDVAKSVKNVWVDSYKRDVSFLDKSHIEKN